MRIKDKLALHSAAELRQKAREWLAKSALNRIREEPGTEEGIERLSYVGFRRAASRTYGHTRASQRSELTVDTAKEI
jgi:hypothetical protein